MDLIFDGFCAFFRARFFSLFALGLGDADGEGNGESCGVGDGAVPAPTFAGLLALIEASPCRQ